ncbi:hypothetical protein JCM3774_003758 [Rhodotorula dairenensis]
MKRLFVLCDGTWESALFQSAEHSLTNIARLANAILPEDRRTKPPTPQLKLYLPGLGTGEELVVGAVKGAYGDGLLENVRLAYYFLAQNWLPGDEICLFGFSRGAYTVRLLSSLLGLVGVLCPRSNLHLFPKVVAALCSRRDGATAKARRNALELNQLLERIGANRNRRTEPRFLVSALCIFDTVPLLHHFECSPFGTDNQHLEPDTCKLVLQALSAYEDRPAYRPLILQQDPKGVARGQILRQVWFPGCHTDIGGGYSQHDLSDLTLHWFVGQLSDSVAFDLDYVSEISGDPNAPWGKATAHVGVHVLQSPHTRVLPVEPSRHLFPTFESLHPSLLKQSPTSWPKPLQGFLPRLTASYQTRTLLGGWWQLGAWEQEIKKEWRKRPLPAHLASDESVLDLITAREVVTHVGSARSAPACGGGIRRWLAYEQAKINGAGNSWQLAHAR